MLNNTLLELQDPAMCPEFGKVSFANLGKFFFFAEIFIVLSNKN